MKDEKPRKPRRPNCFPWPAGRDGPWEGHWVDRPAAFDLKSCSRLVLGASRMQAAGGMQNVGKGIALRQYQKSMLSISMRKKCKRQLNQRTVGRSLWSRHLEGLSEPL